VDIRLHRVRLLKVIQECRHHGVPPAVLYRIDCRQSRKEYSSFQDDDDDDGSGSENSSIGATSSDALDAALAGRESLMDGEGKEGGIVGQEAATGIGRNNNDAGYERE